jgi:hypothetical protein
MNEALTDDQWNIAIRHLRALIMAFGIPMKLGEAKITRDDTIWHYIICCMRQHGSGSPSCLIPVNGHLRLSNVLFEHLHTTILLIKSLISIIQQYHGRYGYGDVVQINIPTDLH